MIILRDAKLTVDSAGAAAPMLQGWLATLDAIDQDREHFIAITLDVRVNVKLVEVVSVGTIGASLVHPREVFTRAVLSRASYIVVAHNHPSGNCEPSDEDIQVTQRLREAGAILGIRVIDHIIFSPTSHFSFMERGMI